jgi:glycosyltransferase 2 family protein
MHLRTAFVSILALALVAWFLRDANIADVWTQVQHARISLLVLAFACVLATYWARAIRWHYLLAPVGHARFRSVFRATVIGFAALAILPARVGDVLRPYLLARREGLSTTATFATIVLERVLDLIAVLTLLAIYVWGFAGDNGLPERLLRPIEVSATLAAAIAALLLGVMWVLGTHPERIGALAAAGARILPGRLSDRVGQLASTFSGGFAAARDPRALLLAVLWSFPLWLAIAAEAWAVTVAFGIAMPFAGTFLLQSLLVIGVAVPTPGGVGSYHEAYRIGVTTFFGAPNDRAVAAAIVTHAISFVPVVLLGVVFMAQDGLSVSGLKDLAGAARKTDEKEGAPTDEVPVLRPSGR